MAPPGFWAGAQFRRNVSKTIAKPLFFANLKSICPPQNAWPGGPGHPKPGAWHLGQASPKAGAQFARNVSKTIAKPPFFANLGAPGPPWAAWAGGSGHPKPAAWHLGQANPKAGARFAGECFAPFAPWAALTGGPSSPKSGAWLLGQASSKPVHGLKARKCKQNQAKSMVLCSLGCLVHQSAVRCAKASKLKGRCTVCKEM